MIRTVEPDRPYRKRTATVSDRRYSNAADGNIPLARVSLSMEPWMKESENEPTACGNEQGNDGGVESEAGENAQDS